MSLTPEQERVAQEIIRIGERRREGRKRINANLSIGLVESRLRNLRGGHADSYGYRQQRESIYGRQGLRRQINNAYDEMDQLARGQSAGRLAADIQRPREDLRGKYAEAMPEAKQIRRALSRGAGGGLTLAGPTRTSVTLGARTIPGQSFAAERADARAQLLLGGDMSLSRLLDYKRTVNSMKDVPERTVPGDLQVKRTQGKDIHVGVKRTGAPHGQGRIYEAFYDPAGKYWDSGSMQRGAIGGHGGHVHVSADERYVVKLGHFAQKMGLNVGEQRKFGGTPTGGHAEGSYHYRDMGIDVTGDPQTLMKFYRVVLRAARSGRGR